jgi:hypothetical protein
MLLWSRSLHHSSATSRRCPRHVSPQPLAGLHLPHHVSQKLEIRVQRGVAHLGHGHKLSLVATPVALHSRFVALAARHTARTTIAAGTLIEGGNAIALLAENSRRGWQRSWTFDWWFLLMYCLQYGVCHFMELRGHKRFGLLAPCLSCNFVSSGITSFFPHVPVHTVVFFDSLFLVGCGGAEFLSS